VFWATCIHRR